MATTTTPRRPRATAKTTAAKVAPAEALPEETAGPVTEDDTTKVTFVLEQGEDTKSYAVFSPAPNTGCVGKLYVPKGTQVVRMQLVGPADVVKPD